MMKCQNENNSNLFSCSRCTTSTCKKYIRFINEAFTFSRSRNRQWLVSSSEVFFVFFILIIGLSQITTAVDIYSLGMVTLEVFLVLNIFQNKRSQHFLLFNDIYDGKTKVLEYDISNVMFSFILVY